MSNQNSLQKRYFTRFQKENFKNQIQNLKDYIQRLDFDNLPRDFSESTDLLFQFACILQELMRLSRECDNYDETEEYYSFKYELFQTIFRMFTTSSGHKLNRLYPQLRKDLDLQRKELIYKLEGIDDKKMRVLKEYLQSYT